MDDVPELQDRAAGRRSALRLFALGVVLGFLSLVVGLGLGIWTYDKRFIYDDPSPVWEAVSVLGLLMVLAGVVVVVVSVLGAVVVAITRSLRRAVDKA
jgi:hypothetical protein